MDVKKKLKISLFLLLLAISGSMGCQVSLEQDALSKKVGDNVSPDKKVSRGIVDSTDPNLDPNWSWTSDQYYTMYYGPSNTMLTSRRLPFFTPGHPLNNHYTEKDMYPEDGWVLVCRDFGTPTRSPELPFFVLYNKYRAILRIMFYNAKQYTYTHYKVTIKWNNPSQTGAYFTFADKDNCFLNEYDKTKEDLFISTADALGGWGYADFIMAGYDPNANPDAVLNVKILGVNIQDTSEKGDIKLTEEVKAHPVGGKVTGASILESVKSGVKYFNDVNDIKRTLSKEAAAKPTAPWSTALTKVLNSTVGTIAPWVGGVVGVISSFIGGMKKPAPREPMVFNGTLSLTGSIQEVDNLLTIGLLFKTGALTVQGYRPVQNISFGIFNIMARPVFYNQRTTRTQSNGTQEIITSFGFTTPVQYQVNPTLNIVSVKLAKASLYYSLPSSFGQELSYGVSPLVEVYLNNGYGMIYFVAGGTPPTMSDAVAIEIKLKNNTAKYNDDEIVLYKVFPVRMVY